MTGACIRQTGVCLLLLLLLALAVWQPRDPVAAQQAGRREVVFWHFWGGTDRAVVEEVVARFNASQQEYFVRPVAMPGNNLELKFFLAVTGGNPPDLLNLDDPIVADWAYRGALTPLDELASPAEQQALDHGFLYPAAHRLGAYRDRMYALPNGLDIRLLYYNQTMLDQHGLQPPTTPADLDNIAQRIAAYDSAGRRTLYGYLPDSRRLWAWGVVFGGDFYDEATGRVTADSEPIVEALEWMAAYKTRYGADEISRFRTGDQSLPGKPFPLLAERYAVLMDGQWRVRDIAAHQAEQQRRGEPVTWFDVVPLPAPAGGRQRAGWVNGNLFVVPRGAPQADGAWQFMKFWVGLGGNERAAAETCIAGGWIPVSNHVARQPVFQEYLQHRPLFARFVSAAGGENQFPVPVIPGAPYFDSRVKEAAELVMLKANSPSPREALEEASRRVQQRLDALRQEAPHETP